MISVVIPCYNAAPWLRAALESVLAQSRPVSEIIVVDDGSTDTSRAIAAEYPVRLLKNDVNKGVAAASNIGLRAASHDMVAWLAADDFWDTEHCSTVGALLDLNPTAAVAFSAVRFVGDRSGIWAMPVPCPGPSFMLWESFDYTIVPGNSVVTRRQACLDVGGFREDLAAAADFDLWIRMALKHPFVWTQEVTANYRWHPKQISRNPLGQVRSMYYSRTRLARENEAAGKLELAHAMRLRTRACFDRDLEVAWSQADMPRLRALLALADTHDVQSRVTRKLRRRSRVPASVVRSWRAMDRLINRRAGPSRRRGF